MTRSARGGPAASTSQLADDSCRRSSCLCRFTFCSQALTSRPLVALRLAFRLGDRNEAGGHILPRCPTTTDGNLPFWNAEFCGGAPDHRVAITSVSIATTSRTVANGRAAAVSAQNHPNRPSPCTSALASHSHQEAPGATRAQMRWRLRAGGRATGGPTTGRPTSSRLRSETLPPQWSPPIRVTGGNTNFREGKAAISKLGGHCGSLVAS